ncbi:NAD-dependent protein deacetylase of SIR2 family [hydrothermal vent metagenome]|uniref:NAD-dependent protein deacetylase of SIR2 family n=1 Tax=hydrothermal vent metagenome TaxID=652676 RepID=A0A1W1CEN8_9ZZZZ
MDNIQEAREIIAHSDALFILAGAGMGVDSGLPDFRGDDGFWREYPKAKELGLEFAELANPKWFIEDPQLAWAFYGDRLHQYRETTPHLGFDRLLEVAQKKKHGYFVFTSNVDGAFQKAGFDEDRVMECHGSIHYLQCVDDCSREIWSADDTSIDIDDDTFQAQEPLPICSECGRLARPNILMFGDMGWNYSRTDRQRARLVEWLDMVEDNNSSLAIVEIGAGTAVPTVRNSARQIADRFEVPLIRINPAESFGAEIGISMGGLSGIIKITEGA